MQRILLVEPSYKNKYPPLGLMKLAAYHKETGDYVRFAKGFDAEKRDQKWDRIYITTLFTFYWNLTIKTIKYYRHSTHDRSNVKVGGIMATLLSREIEKETGIKPVAGFLNEKGKIGFDNDDIIHNLPPDYHILEDIDYEYPINDAYFGYMTRGCKRNCEFCAVSILEPEYIDYISIKHQKEVIDRKYGEKKDLLLLDNNILPSLKFHQIIDEILEMGFYKGAKLNGRLRYVDFNQGIDIHFLSKEKMKRLSELPIKPLRIAFDDIKLRDLYIRKIRMAAKYGFARLSNYILFNYNDSPEDFYERLRINVELNEQLGLSIYSFPMKYVPIYAKNRNFVGRKWNKRNIRGVQCILNATHGLVGPKKEFFEKAFGKNVDEFKKLIIMPENYIIYRAKYENNGHIDIWESCYDRLSSNERREACSSIAGGKGRVSFTAGSPRLREFLNHYRDENE